MFVFFESDRGLRNRIHVCNIEKYNNVVKNQKKYKRKKIHTATCK